MTRDSEASGCRSPSGAGSVLLGMPAVSRSAAAAAGSGRGLAGLRYVEVETARLCNRTCPWCPNGHSGARRTQQLLPWRVFAKVSAELGAAGFDGFVALHNYNEPLANPRLHEELALLRTAAPQARPAIYTNGDLLKRDGLERLLSAGVKYVRVTRYPFRASAAPTEEALRRWLCQARIADCYPWVFGPVRQGLAARWQDEAAGVLVEVIRPQIATYNDRGGTALVPVQAPARTEPCRMTATSLSVDYRGLVKMCCNVIPDSAPGHERYVVGSAADATLAELWNSPVMAGWRARHAAADWSDSPACRSCVQVLPETRR
jgi:Radical SAM superfamily/Iron-sulfur cluster-binding domain